MASAAGLKVRAVIPVDLFGQPADYRPITAIALEEKLFVLGDAAQSFGAKDRNRCVGTLADATATSFFPSKPLGVYGDGGAVFTDDDELAETIRSLRVHGEGRERYDCQRIGLNGRFDSVQAAVLIEKLKIFSDEITARDRIARRYSAALADVAAVPMLREGATSVWAQYTIRLPSGRRDAFAAALKAQGIPTAVHYPRPVHRQTAYQDFPVVEGGAPVSERLASEVISLPMHAYLDEPTQDRIIRVVRGALSS
jgi:dTDP-4-amino-4,6-dideoxygalactose transaminase